MTPHPLLTELLDRLDRLPLLAPPTRALVETSLRATDREEDLRRFADVNLRSLEKVHAGDGQRADVRALAARIADMTSPAAVMAEFGLTGYTFVDWLGATERAVEPARLLYCIVNQTALLPFHITSLDLESTPAARAFSVYLTWHTQFHVLEDKRAALAVLEEWLRLAPEVYRDDALGRHLDERLRDAAADTALRIIAGLADGLAIHRDDAMLAVLQAFLAIGDDLYHDREALRRHLDQFHATWVRRAEEFYRGSPPEVSALILTGKHGIGHWVADLIRGLAWCWHRLGHTDRGVVVFGAYLGIWPDDLSSLGTLGRRIAGSSFVAARDRLVSWAALVGRASRQAETFQTFRAALAAPAPGARVGADRGPRIPPRWRPPEADAAALLFVVMAGWPTTRTRDVVDLYDTCGGVGGGGDAAPRGSPAWLAHVAPAFADVLVFVIAFALADCNLFDQLVGLLEARFAVSGGDYYHPPDVRHRFLTGRPHVTADRRLAVGLLMMWVVGLHATDRMAEAACLLDAVFPHVARDPVARYQEFYSEIGESPPLVGEQIWVVISQILFFGGRFDECRQLLERHLNITPGDYGRRAGVLGPKLRARRAAAPDENLDGLVMRLGAVLAVDGRPGRAAVLIEEYLGIDAAAWHSPAVMRQRLASTGPYGRASLPATLASSYIKTGQAARAVVLLEALTDPDSMRDHAAPGWLRRVREKLFPGSFVGACYPETVDVACTLLDALRGADLRDQYHRLLDTLDRDDDWLGLAPGPATLSVLRLAVHVLNHLEDRDPGRAHLVCGRVVDHLRDRTTRLNLAAYDRLLLAEYSAAVRRKIVTLGHTLTTREAVPRRADELRRQFLCWDAELGHRMLLERFLCANPSPGTDGAAGPVPGWACGETLSAARAAHAAAGPASFGRRSEPPGGTPERGGRPLPPPTTRGPDALAASLRPGIGEARLAAVLGDRRVLFRVGFTSSGQLAWALFGRAGDRLRVVAGGHTAPGARARVAAAARRHDEAIRDGWERFRLGEPETWGHVMNHVAGLTEHISRAEWGELPGSRALWRLERLLKEYGLTTCRDLLRRQFPHLWPAAGESPPAIDVAHWRQFWDDRKAAGLDPPALTAYLDAATAEFLAAVAAAWPLAEVAAALDRVPDHDVVVQVDDALHGVPVAFLRHDDRFLFERVRSMHAVLSLSLVEWLEDVDRGEWHDTRDEPDNILSLSWFARGDDGPRNGAVLLHRGHQRLAPPGSGRTWYSSADHPPGTHACLARGLRAHRAFRVVSVCGHGHGGLSGIELGDGVWNGSSLLRKDGDTWRASRACDLRGIELLIQVSCSVGRVRQSGLQDVEGFCVELATHRARSVLAGLWPLHSLDAPAFANDVAGHYLRLRDEVVRGATAARPAAYAGTDSRPGAAARDPCEARPRAGAVAAARHQWLADTRAGRPAVGLNTVAAFELYGLG
ncbi:hypothetical protein [Fimbriiglobus ruber]|uniref:CHAT domain-containing protein n=1 Tax=Fimbriiglobus ruber TaxID=1908690 RepID=A0A225DHN3_9BACT|nr:hypothetical protein [Fimbriiglobus ruber]OWK40991.1 hypothetical protein FRUB_04883 [Fimbriiglobus ruber]